MTLTTDAAALFAAIRQFPDDDVPRLALADELEESGDADRAAFIRLQCEIAAWGQPGPEEARKAGNIVRRARAGSPVSLKSNTPATKLAREQLLWEKHGTDWRRGPKCAECEGSGGFTYPAVGRTNDCADCFASGDVGGLLKPDHHHRRLYKDVGPHEVTYHRGMKRVQCLFAEVYEPLYTCGCGAVHRSYLGTCTGCMGRGHERTTVAYRPTAWASAVCRHHPDVTEFWVALPFDLAPGRNEWRHPQESGSRSGIPLFLFERIHGHDTTTADAAHTAMARALACWVHDFPKETQ